MRYAFDALRRRRGRTAATAFGIGLATALVLVLLTISAGVGSSAGRLAASSGIDLLATSANTTLAGGSFPPVESAHLVPAAMRAADPNVGAASPWLLSSLVFANASLFAASNASPSGAGVPAGWSPTTSGAVGWIPSDNVGLKTPSVVVGPGFSSSGDPHYANGSYAGPRTGEVVLDQGLAGALGVGPGDLLWMSPRSVAGPADLAGWFANATAFRVVGISEPFWLIPSALLGFLYLSELQGLLGKGSAATDEATLVLLHLTDPGNPEADQTVLAHAFPALSVFTIGNVLGAVQSVIDLYRTFGTLIGLIGVIVATLFTTTVLLMSVDDRSRELALLRALGYSRARVAGFVLEEAVLLALLGLAVGLPLGLLGAYGLNRFLLGVVGTLPAGFAFVTFDAQVLASGVVEVLLIGLAAAILPALRTLRLPVADELRAP